MRAIFIILSFVSMSATLHAQNLQPAGGGGHEPVKKECITPAQRADIEKMLDANRKMLTEKGILKENNRGAKTTSTMFDWPLHQVTGGYFSYYYIGNYVDLDTTYPGHLLDWNCGTRTYDLSSGYNHGGIDIALWPFEWNNMEDMHIEIVAAAPGTIIGKTDGNPDHNCAMGSGTWNSVYIQHADGTVAWYGHMKNGSTTSSPVGTAVLAGDHLGFVGSSGSSTAPHLHFEVHDATGHVREPFHGSCNSLPTMWNAQKPYNESSVNVLMTHYAAPGMAACPLRDTINARDTFAPGSTIYFASYYHDQQAGQTSYYSILRPDGSAYDTWTYASGSSYTASYWYWYNTIPASEPRGHWKFVDSFQTVRYVHDFYILDPTFTTSVNEQAVSVYPNPAHSYIYISTGTATDAELVNALGQKVLSVHNAGNKVDISQFPAGMYYLRLVTDGKTSVHKILLQ